MMCIMEALLRVWVKRMLQPLNGVGQPHKVTAFDWTPAHWAQMAQQSGAVAQTRYAAMQADRAEKKRQAAEKLDRAKRQDDKDIGTFEL